MYNKKHVFRLQSFAFNIIFAARTKEEFEKWMEGFEKLQKETEENKKKVLAKQKLEPVDRTKDAKNALQARATVRNK